jgi:hypothetical protein
MPTEKVEKSSFGIAAILIAAWAVVLLVAFFANRGSDVGQIGKLIGNLGGGPLFGWEGFRDSFVGGIVAIVILISWFSLGSLITKFVRREQGENHSHVLENVINVAVGAAAWSLVWFFLGLAGAYNTASSIVAIVVGIALALFGFGRLREMRSESRTPEKASGIDWLLFILIAVPVLLALIGSLAPPTAKDTLLYHFALPKAFIAQHSNAFVEGNIASYLSLGAEMHNVWAMLLGGLINARVAEAAAGAVNWLLFPLLLAAVFGWARELNVSRRLSLIAVLIVAAIPTAYHEASSAYVDLELALYVMLAVYGLTRWWRTLGIGWLILAAIFLGAALSIKLTTVFIFAAAALVIIFRAREAKENSSDVGRIIGLGFAALILAGVIASPWYLRTWAATGSPVFPFYMSLWEGKAAGWDVERSNLFQEMNSRYGGERKTAVDYVISPWNLSVNAQPEIARNFDGVLGVAFLIGLPILIFGLWKLDLPAEVKICVAVAAIAFLFWLFSSQQLRYLLPIAPLLAISIMAAAEKIDSATRRVLKIALITSGVAGILVSFAWFCQRAPLRFVLGVESRDAFLTRNLDYYPYYAWLNAESPADSRVWLLNMRRDTYDLERPAVSDYLFEDWTLRQMVWESRNTAELRGKIAAMNVQYILSRNDILLDYDRSALVDDKKPRAENEAKLKMAREVLLDPAKTVKADNKFSLIKVF